MFKNRKDAGEKLANALEKYRPEKPVILAIPRGGSGSWTAGFSKA